MGTNIYLVIINVSPESWHATIRDWVQLIGRGQAAHIRIPMGFTSVSRRHAELWADSRQLWLRDVGSSAGTRVNGVRLKPHQKYQIRLGDRLWLGGAELEVTSSLTRYTHVHAAEGDAGSCTADDTVKFRENAETAKNPLDVLFHTLTHAEQMVVLWMSRGYTSPEQVATKLCRSPHTVRTQLNSIFRKLGVHSREELLGWLKRSELPDDSGITSRRQS